MKFTFLRPKDVGFYEWEKHMIAKWMEWDYFFVNDKKEIERLKGLTDIWYIVFSWEDISEKWVEKSEEENKKEEEKEASRDIHDEYKAKYGKEVPRNKKKDVDWIGKELEKIDVEKSTGKPSA